MQATHMNNNKSVLNLCTRFQPNVIQPSCIHRLMRNIHMIVGLSERLTYYLYSAIGSAHAAVAEIYFLDEPTIN